MLAGVGNKQAQAVKTGLQTLSESPRFADRNRQKAKGVTKVMSSGKKQSRKENTGTARKLQAVMHNKANMLGHESELCQSIAITLCSKQLPPVCHRFLPFIKAEMP